MNIKEIKEMIALMNENSLLELEVEKDGMRIRLKKTGSEVQGYSGPVMIHQEKISEQPISRGAAEVAAPSLKVNSVEIKAPMVGTFYRAPSRKPRLMWKSDRLWKPGKSFASLKR